MSQTQPVTPAEVHRSHPTDLPQDDPDPWVQYLRRSIVPSGSRAVAIAKRAVHLFPDTAEILHLACLAALVEQRPKEYLHFLNSLQDRYNLLLADYLLLAIYQAQKGHWPKAALTLKQHGLNKRRALQIATGFWSDVNCTEWVLTWLETIKQGGHQPSKKPATKKNNSRSSPTLASPPATKKEPAALPPEDPLLAAFPELPKLQVHIPIRYDIPEPLLPPLPASSIEERDLSWFNLREEFTHLGLLQGFNELLCLTHIQQVDTYGYQVETVRKVLKQFRGRVLLADEVGLGKTIEAGMILKEYVLRGMAERILILTPASLVGQWQEEMAVKFAVSFTTTQDAEFRTDPAAFWANRRIIASLAVARREEQAALLINQRFDLIIVDEAHHLRNRTTRNWKLVDSLNKRFLILLTATPVQNSLVELYNLLTLLKPGIFPTEKEFRNQYVSPKNPRTPLHPERLRELMKGCMVRNKRALVDVRLPPRHAITQRVAGENEELACYQELSRLIREQHALGSSPQLKMSHHHLLTSAGSSPMAAIAALERFLLKHPDLPVWVALLNRYRQVSEGGKMKALLTLLERNPNEKKLIFIHHRETLKGIAHVLKSHRLAHCFFDGSMSGAAKDAAVATFRDQVEVMLCTESGGEGRNLQFCNTLINFDLPWSPMAIEQRIGRIHRIGQTREVFIFNLALRDTVEDHLLALLDEKLNLFELVVGEVDAILGDMDEAGEFTEAIFSAWVTTTEEQRHSAFSTLGERMQEALSRHEATKILDETLFGDDFEA